MDDAIQETWRPVVGYGGYYEVSDRGQIRSLHTPARRILKPGTLKPSGHLHVDLWVNGTGTTKLVHHLVLEAFDKPRPPGAECRHLNGNPADNRWPQNLVWGTHSENQRDAVRHGTQRNTRKTHCDSGHEFTPGNTYDNHGARGCCECRRKAGLAWYYRNKGAP